METKPWDNHIIPPITTTPPDIVYVNTLPDEEDLERAVKHVQDAAAREPLTVDRASAAGRIRQLVQEAVAIATGCVVLTPEQMERIRELQAEGRKPLPGEGT